MRPHDPALSFESIFEAELASLRSDYHRTKHGKIADTVDHLSTPLVALCLSGGGIRSASFALGVLQGLARFKLLGQVDYLSTVSGGGYIGSFLTAWRYHAKEDDAVFRGLDRPVHADSREATQITGIRAYSNYLTPKLGILSADSWTDLAIVIRNLLLNWLVFLPFFMGALLLPQICRDIVGVLQQSEGSRARYLLALGLAFATAGFTAASYGRRRSEGAWLTNGRFLLLCMLPLVLASICLTGYTATPSWRSEMGTNWLFGAALGVACYVGSSLVASAALRVRGKAHALPWSEIFYDLAAWAAAGALVGWLLMLGMRSRLIFSTCNLTLFPPLLTVTGISWLFLCVLCGELLFVGLRSYSPRGDMDREWLARSAGWFAALAAGWSIFSAISLYGPYAAGQAQHRLFAWSTLGVTGVSGAVSLVLGSGVKTAARASQMVGRRLSLNDIASIAGVIFALALATLVSWLDDDVRAGMARFLLAFAPLFSWPDDDVRAGAARFLSRTTPDWRYDAVGAAMLVSFSVIVSCFINVNRFSLHGLYRNRLVRAFLGSARRGLYPADPVAAARIRAADPFTDFAEHDNLRMAKMPVTRLLHVVNVTLDIVSTKNLAWQQRKAESFTISPLACGNPHVGYRPTERFGSKEGGITLGSAMAISGAAVSPNMGSHSSPLLGFLMTLFNLRLGWWLGNPQFAGPARREGPRVGLWPLLQELAGQTTDERAYIYLSDGGHFDNLGLYEMVRRRCRVIVVSDAGCDPNCALSDLGDCLRKIYIDLGVSIDFRNFDIKARQTPPVDGRYAAIADITYPGSPMPGWLLYIKPGFHGSERADIRSYAAAHLDFPHESTARQWFGEAQLESYRALGAHITELLCHGGDPVRPADTPHELDIAAFKISAETATGSHRPSPHGARTP